MNDSKFAQNSRLTLSPSGEGGSGSDGTRRRGRIPQSAWPRILERHRGGATLSEIAREFDCTPSAISYIVRKAEAAGIEPANSVSDDSVPAGNDDTAPSPSNPAGEDASPTGERKPARSSSQPALSLNRDRAPTPRTGNDDRQSREDAVQTSPRAEDEAAVEATGVETGASGPVRPTEPPAPEIGGEPVDDVERRLRKTSQDCIESYRVWFHKQTDPDANRKLDETLHELRKVMARLEIQMAASRRDEQAARPIPIPMHRASRRGN